MEREVQKRNQKMLNGSGKLVETAYCKRVSLCCSTGWYIYAQSLHISRPLDLKRPHSSSDSRTTSLGCPTPFITVLHTNCIAVCRVSGTLDIDISRGQ